MREKAVKFKITVATLGCMTLLLLMFTLTIPSPSHAAIFFDTSFETCSVGTGKDFPCDGWDDFGQESVGHLEINNSLAFSGSKSVKGTFVDLLGNSTQPSIWRSFTRIPHLFIRFATRTSSGFQTATNGHTKMIRITDVNYPVFGIIHRYGNYGVVVEGPYDATGSTDAFQTSVVPSQTSWDQVELEILLNTPGRSNGLMRLWINGVLRLEVLNRQWIGPTPTSKGINSGLSNPSTFLLRTAQIFIQAGLGNKWYDRFSVGDTRIGLATSNSSSDTVPPAIPLGVQAQ